MLIALIAIIVVLLIIEATLIAAHGGICAMRQELERTNRLIEDQTTLMKRSYQKAAR